MLHKTVLVAGVLLAGHAVGQQLVDVDIAETKDAGAIDFSFNDNVVEFSSNDATYGLTFDKVSPQEDISGEISADGTLDFANDFGPTPSISTEVEAHLDQDYSLQKFNDVIDLSGGGGTDFSGDYSADQTTGSSEAQLQSGRGDGAIIGSDDFNLISVSGGRFIDANFANDVDADTLNSDLDRQQAGFGRISLIDDSIELGKSISVTNSREIDVDDTTAEVSKSGFVETNTNVVYDRGGIRFRGTDRGGVTGDVDVSDVDLLRTWVVSTPAPQLKLLLLTALSVLD